MAQITKAWRDPGDRKGQKRATPLTQRVLRGLDIMLTTSRNTPDEDMTGLRLGDLEAAEKWVADTIDRKTKPKDGPK